MMRKLDKSKISVINKFISLAIVFLLLSTVFISSATSKDILSNIVSKTKDNIENFEIKTDGAQTTVSMGEKITNVKDTIEKINENIQSIKNNTVINFLKSYNSFFKLKRLSSTSSIFSVYTNYAGNEKTTPIRFGITTAIDVDDDGDRDIKTSFRIFPSIEKPLIFTFNIDLKVDRLIGFEDINEFFEVYLEFTLPGILEANNTGDKVKFGYQSLKYDEVPNICHVAYKYQPYLFYLEKPKHKISFNPGIIADEDPLALIFGYDNALNISGGASDFSSKSKWAIHFNPVVKTDIVFGGADDYVGRQLLFDSSDSSTVTISYTRFREGVDFNAGLVIDKVSSFSFEMEVTPFKKGGGRIEYKSNSSELANVTLFFEKFTSVYLYVEDIPQHVKLSWTPETDGIIELNTFDNRLYIVGIRDTPPGASSFKYKAYLENLPSLAHVKWNWEPLNGGKIDTFCNEAGVSAHLIGENILGENSKIIADFSTNENIDMSLFWDFSINSFGIRRTSSDLHMDLHVLGSNGTSFDFSGSVRNTIDGPFQIILGDILDGNSDITFTSNVLEIYNVDAELKIPSVGKFIVKFTEMVFGKDNAGIAFRLSVNNNGDTFTLNVEIEVFNGITIHGLVIGYDDFLYPFRDIENDGHQLYKFSLTATNVDIDFWISEDKSSGYVRISGGLIVTFNSNFERPVGEKIGFVVGSVTFNSASDYLSISWETVDSQLQFNIDGAGVASISGFNLWVKDKLDIKIPLIVGEFSIDTLEKTGNVKLFLSKSSASLRSDFSLNITDLMNVTLKFDLSVDFAVGLSGFVGFAWSNGVFEFINGDGGAGFDGTLSVYDLYYKTDQTYDEEGISKSAGISASELIIDGDLFVDLSFGFKNDTISEFEILLDSKSMVSLEANDVEFYQKYGIGDEFMDNTFQDLSFSKLYLGATGTIYGNLEDLYLEIDAMGEIVLKTFHYSGYASDINQKQIMNANIEVDGGGKIIADLKNGYAEFDIIGDFYVALNGNYPMEITIVLGAVVNSAKFSVYFDFDMDSGELELQAFVLESEKDLSLDDIQISFMGFELICSKFFLRLCGDALVIFKPETSYTPAGISISAGITYLSVQGLYFVTATSDFRLSLYGSLNLRGPLLIEADSSYSTSDTDPPVTNSYLIVTLPGGYVEITGVQISYVPKNTSGAQIHVAWDRLVGAGAMTVYASRDKISAAGAGGVLFDGLSLDVTQKGKTLIHLGYFGLQLDQVHGAVVELSLSDPTQFAAAFASGSISQFTIKDFYVNLSITEFGVTVTDLNVEFSGSGQFTASARGLDDVNIQGSVSGNGHVTLVKFHLDLGTSYFALNNLDIIGPTTYSLIIESISELEGLSAVITCNSEITFNNLDVNGTLLVTNFVLYGQISLGGIIGSLSGEAVDIYGTFGIAGLASFDSLELEYKGIIFKTKVNFEGNAIFSVYLNAIMAYMPLSDIRVILTVNEPTIIDLLVECLDISFNALSLEMQPGQLTISGELTDAGIIKALIDSSGTVNPRFDIIKLEKISTGERVFSLISGTINVPYLRLETDILQGDGNGYLLIDTNNNLITGTFVVGDFNNIDAIIISASLKTDDLLIEWNLDGDGVGYIQTTNNNPGSTEISLEILNQYSISGSLSKYLRFEWNLDGDGDGGLFLDTNHEYCQINLGFNNIELNGGFWAEDKQIIWDFNNTLFTIFNISGDWGSQPEDFDINVKVDGNWYSIFNTNLVSGSPVADAGGPYSSSDCLITFDFSGCSDPDGDEITEMNVNWRGMINGWTGWIPFEEHPTHDYITPETCTLYLRVKDSTGKKSNIDSATVNAGVDIVQVTGHVYDSSTNKPLTSGDDDADVAVVGENHHSGPNRLGEYILHLDKNKYYTLKASAFGYESQQIEIYTDSNQIHDFRLDPGGEMDISLTWKGDKLYENQWFRVTVKDETGDGIPIATVTYQYQYMFQWHDVIDGTKQTNPLGQADFTAIEVNSGDFATCRIKVSHSLYGLSYSENFYVENDDTGDNHAPYFISGVSDKTWIEGSAGTWYISAYDSDEDWLTFTDLTTDYDENGSCTRFQQVDSDSIQYGFAAPYDNDNTGDHIYHIKIIVSDGDKTATAQFIITVKDKVTCFLAETKITMADDTYKNIENIQIGDLVKSYDPDTQMIVTTEVTRTFRHAAEEMADHYLIINNNLRVTPRHKIFVNNKWIIAGEIKIGDKILDINGKQVTVSKIEKIYQKVPTYNFEVDQIHTYFAEDIVVHNGKG